MANHLHGYPICGHSSLLTRIFTVPSAYKYTRMSCTNSEYFDFNGLTLKIQAWVCAGLWARSMVQRLEYNLGNRRFEIRRQCHWGIYECRRKDRTFRTTSRNGFDSCAKRIRGNYAKVGGDSLWITKIAAQSYLGNGFARYHCIWHLDLENGKTFLQ